MKHITLFSKSGILSLLIRERKLLMEHLLFVAGEYGAVKHQTQQFLYGLTKLMLLGVKNTEGYL